MKSLALRLTLLGVFVAAAASAAYFSWTSRTHGYRDAGQAASFDESSVGAERDVLELRAAQEGYVAAGQEDQFWASRVDATTDRLRETLTTLRAQATAPEAQSAIDNASSALQDFEQMDRRAREHARTGQKLLASDLIFTDGVELAGAAAGAVEDARLAERRYRTAALAALERREIAAAAAALAIGLIAVGLLVPRTDAPAAIRDLTARTAPRLDRPAARPGGLGIDEGWTAAKVIPRAEPAGATAATTSARPAARAGAVPAAKAAASAASSTHAAKAAAGAAPTAPSPDSSKPAAAQAPAPAPAITTPTLDLPGVALLCSDLARVVDTQALPSLLERAAAVLDAPGIVVWIADPDGRELSPVVTHGYPTQLVSRLGTIARDAENATASAFRTALLQTVRADAVSNGAIAAPLVTPAGCVGVMAAEVRKAGEEDAGKLAIAAIVAAQLATLVGPPSARAQARAEAADA